MGIKITLKQGYETKIETLIKDIKAYADAISPTTKNTFRDGTELFTQANLFIIIPLYTGVGQDGLGALMNKNAVGQCVELNEKNIEALQKLLLALSEQPKPARNVARGMQIGDEPIYTPVPFTITPDHAEQTRTDLLRRCREIVDAITLAEPSETGNRYLENLKRRITEVQPKHLN